MSANIPEPWASQKSALYILGAGFSAAAGLPLADDLWREVCRRALPMTGRLGQFREDLDDYIQFKQRCDGKTLSRDEINFEEFLGFLDVEHHLRLRGKDTWSEEGNESQVLVKTLIGQILTEKMPRPAAIPPVYLDFAKKLQPWDKVITFNYDTLLERACEVVGKPFRLAPMRYTEVRGSTAAIDESCMEEIIILKLHGSIDWFDRKHFVCAKNMRGKLDIQNTYLMTPSLIHLGICKRAHWSRVHDTKTTLFGRCIASLILSGSTPTRRFFLQRQR